MNALGPDFQSCINDHSGEVSIRPREVRRKAKRDRVGSWTDHWNAGSQRDDLFDEQTGERLKEIGTACDDLASEVAKRSGWPSVEYRSTIRFCPSIKPSLFSSSKYTLYVGRPLLVITSGSSLGWKMASGFTPGDRALVCAQAGQAKLSATVAARFRDLPVLDVLPREDHALCDAHSLAFCDGAARENFARGTASSDRWHKSGRLPPDLSHGLVQVH